MAEGLLKYSSTEGLNLQLGQGGYIYRAPSGITSYSDDTYVAITALEAASAGICNVVVFPTDEAISDQDTILIPVGTTIYGRWKTIVLISGDKVILYKGS